MRTVVGIDPGMHGGLAALGETCVAMPMPTIGKELDVYTIAVWLRQQEPSLVVIEQVSAMPGNGVAGMFRFGMHYGMLHGIVQTLWIPFRLVRPQAWKKLILAGTDHGKTAAIEHVTRAYPDIELMPGRCRKPHDGIADAVCIAEWGRRWHV